MDKAENKLKPSPSPGEVFNTLPSALASMSYSEALSVLQGCEYSSTSWVGRRGKEGKHTTLGFLFCNQTTKWPQISLFIYLWTQFRAKGLYTWDIELWGRKVCTSPKSTFRTPVWLALIIDLSRVTEASKRPRSFTQVCAPWEREKCETGDNRDNFWKISPIDFCHAFASG